ncbi:MAG: TetR/AcrR family transcriptional regulator [Firmicutes bacterium]|jgi:AcrR family transcriptional regulator|nr:TetR/AcrR family transcriptional regulator [Bacillota bacterium]
MLSKSDRTKKMILEKATELFIKKGYSAVTMKDVCEATGLSRGGLYRHFSSTGEMIICLIRAEQQNADNEFKKALAEGKSALQMLDLFIDTHNRFLLSPKSGLELAANQFALLDEKGKQINAERAWSTVKRTSYLVRLGQEEGVFIDGDPESIAWHIVLFLGGLRTKTALDGAKPDFIYSQTNWIREFLLKQNLK